MNPGQGTSGDERAKALREAFVVLETASKNYNETRYLLEERRRAVSAAQRQVSNAFSRLQWARDMFERLQKLHAEDQAERDRKAVENS